MDHAGNKCLGMTTYGEGADCVRFAGYDWCCGTESTSDCNPHCCSSLTECAKWTFIQHPPIPTIGLGILIGAIGLFTQAAVPISIGLGLIGCGSLWQAGRTANECVGTRNYTREVSVTDYIGGVPVELETEMPVENKFGFAR